ISFGDAPEVFSTNFMRSEQIAGREITAVVSFQNLFMTQTSFVVHFNKKEGKYFSLSVSYYLTIVVIYYINNIEIGITHATIHVLPYNYTVETSHVRLFNTSNLPNPSAAFCINILRIATRKKISLRDRTTSPLQLFIIINYFFVCVEDMIGIIRVTAEAF
ncbi:hypothetical protein ACJX0J_018442, partial [Zea mays]